MRGRGQAFRIQNSEFRSQESGDRRQETGDRSLGVQEFRSSGVQEFRSSGVQEFRSELNKPHRGFSQLKFFSSLHELCAAVANFPGMRGQYDLAAPELQRLRRRSPFTVVSVRVPVSAFPAKHSDF
jgi:hypothetical protein